MKINYNMKQIEMTKKESKEAARYGSEAYKKLVEIKHDFPDFSIVIREIAHKSSNKGLSYDKMEMYVKSYGTDDQNEQFKSMRSVAKDSMEGKGKTYKEIKEWFNATFPEASDFSAAMARITGQNAG